jgi:hypothetical protein
LGDTKGIEMTPDQIAATKDAIEILRQVLIRAIENSKHGVSLDTSVPIWKAAYHLTQSLPREER